MCFVDSVGRVVGRHCQGGAREGDTDRASVGEGIEVAGIYDQATRGIQDAVARRPAEGHDEVEYSVLSD